MFDEFTFNGEVVFPLGKNGAGLYSAADFGIKTYCDNTACERGYVMKYTCTSTCLLLDGMDVNVDNPPPPVINGVTPGPSVPFFSTSYRNLGLKVPFNGRLFFVAQFVQGAGYAADLPMAYEKTWEVLINAGDVAAVQDWSVKMREFRQSHSEKSTFLRSFTHRQRNQWINETFDLDLEWRF